MAAQWLRVRVSTAEGTGSLPGRGNTDPTRLSVGPNRQQQQQKMKNPHATLASFDRPWSSII